MKRIILRVAVALLTFIVGVVSAALWLTSNNRQPQSKVHDVQVHQALLEPAEQFTPIGGFDGRTLGGGINCEIYRAADGSRLPYLRRISAHLLKRLEYCGEGLKMRKGLSNESLLEMKVAGRQGKGSSYYGELTLAFGAERLCFGQVVVSFSTSTRSL